MNAEYQAFAEKLGRLAGEVIRPLFFNPALTVELKADDSPVTVADREVEKLIRAEINRCHPSHGIIAEEFGNDRPDAEFVWVIDPIDGTVSFTAGCPLFGTLIGLLHQGRPVLGLIYQPIIDQLCIGDNTLTLLNGNPVRARDTATLSAATLLTTDLANIERHQNHAHFEQLRRRARLTRTWGDCYGYLLVAAGLADVMMDPIMNPWDLLPLIPIIRGAGAIISAWDGGDPLTATSSIAAAPKLHAEVIAILNQSAMA
ncbi:MAG: histidinol-phosphatase [Verrucomicrobiales bacterium]|nr:histidinol-phosphatase [Verrucomicrobiales bacterium]